MNNNNDNIIEIKDICPPQKLTNVFIKCLLIGSSGVGKTSILERYSSNMFYGHFITTIGVDYKLKNMVMDNYNIKLQLWDTASQERFRCITTSYYRNSHLIIVCFDLTDSHSFNELDFWIEDAYKHLSEPIQMAICGTKSDLGIKRVISYAEGKSYADYKNLPYFEISSKDNVGIDFMFETLLKNIIVKQGYTNINLIPEIIIPEEKYSVVSLNYVPESSYNDYSQYCCFLY
jgi:small GTP-binding protein